MSDIWGGMTDWLCLLVHWYDLRLYFIVIFWGRNIAVLSPVWFLEQHYLVSWDDYSGWQLLQIHRLFSNYIFFLWWPEWNCSTSLAARMFSFGIWLYVKAVAYSAMQPCQPVTRSNLAECVYIAEQAVTTVCGFRMIYDDGSLFPLLQTFANEKTFAHWVIPPGKQY